MGRRRLDLRVFIMMVGAAAIGAIWAIYNRGLTSPPYDEAELRPLVWVIFAVPFALFLGWLAARRREGWWAAFVCFCLYFFSPFVAQRYESCTIVSSGFRLVDCFTATAQAQQLSNAAGHQIYFESIVVIQLIAAIAITLHRALAPHRAPSGAEGIDLSGAPAGSPNAS